MANGGIDELLRSEAMDDHELQSHMQEVGVPTTVDGGIGNEVEEAMAALKEAAERKKRSTKRRTLKPD